VEEAPVDVVRRMFDLYESVASVPDPRAQGLLVELWHPDAVLAKPQVARSDVDAVGTALCYRGVEGVLALLADLRASWEEFHVVIDEMRDLGDHVLVLATMVGRLKRHGPAEVETSFLVTVRDGKIAFLEAHLGQEALDAAAPVPSVVGPEWAHLGSRLQVPATVVHGGPPVVLGLAEGWEIEVPVTDELSALAAPGTPALVFFHDDGRLAGWYLPDAQVGIDLQHETP
jgi:ketosteroid isomerase-like protein